MPICNLCHSFPFHIRLRYIFYLTIFAHIFPSTYAKCLNYDILRLIRTCGVLPALSLLHMIDSKTVFCDSCEQKKNKGGKKLHFWSNEQTAATFPLLYHSIQERVWSVWSLVPEGCSVGQQAQDLFVTFLECRPGGRNKVLNSRSARLATFCHVFLSDCKACTTLWLSGFVFFTVSLLI